jgi:predicted nuclease of predicted toxin-antitoxin system
VSPPGSQLPPQVRLIWDELLSHPVAKAVRALGFRVTWVGSDDEGVPARGSSDAAVIEFARRTNQVVVTSNHDMMTLCDELGQQFVWIDPRGRQLERTDQVLLVFGQISQWERILASVDRPCVRAMRTKCVPIKSAEAARLARQRMKAIKRQRRSKSASKPAPPTRPLVEDL